MKLEARKNSTQFELDDSIDNNNNNNNNIDNNNQIDEMNNENVFKTFLNTSIPNGDERLSSCNINEVIIRNPSQLRMWLDDMSKRTCRQKVKHVLRSGKFHLALIILVIIESLFVAGEVIIYDLEAYLIKHHSEVSKSSDHPININNSTNNLLHLNIDARNSSSQTFSFNITSNNQDKINSLNNNDTHSNILFKLLHISERTCKYGSIFILTIFMVEIVVKIIFDPKSFRKILEILDGLVIAISFSLNIFLLINNIQVHAISGLITLLRLWRIAEIIQAIAIAIEAKYKSKFRRLEKKIKSLESENEFLRAKLNDIKK